MTIERPVEAIDHLRVMLREHADEQRHHGKVHGRWVSLDGDTNEGELTV